MNIKNVINSRGFEEVTVSAREKGRIFLPERSTKNSAGYDFKSSIDFIIKPKEFALIPTNIKSYMEDDEVLELYVRSSVGILKNIMLANSTGIIDSDYYSNADNDGNIILALYNYGVESQSFKLGDKIVQGIFKKFLITDEDESDQLRTGGTGSSDRNNITVNNNG